MSLTSFRANRHLKTVNLSETLEPDFDLDLYVDHALSTRIPGADATAGQ